MMDNKRPKIFVLGLDGLTFDLIRPWINQGALPTFSKLIQESSYGELESTIPPYSAQAWTSFMTGVNPGKHGIFDLVGFKPNSYDQILKNTLDIRSLKIWDLISEYGYKSIVVNIPLSYPPQKINGVMISGMLTPPGKEFTQPVEVKEELEKEIGSYMIDIEHYRDESLFLKDIYHSTEQRFKAAHYLMKHYDWNLFMMVITETDRIQHLFWGKKESVLLPYYQRLDNLMGHLINHLGKETALIIASDHGFGDLKKTLYLNNWLAKFGLLGKRKIKESKRESIDWDLLMRRNNDDQAMAKRTGSSLKKLMRKFLRRSFDIDWKRTKAFASHSGHIQGIRLNLKGREPQGTVDPLDYETLREFIIDELYRLRDREKVEPIVEKAFKREEIYSGPLLEQSPDILFILKDYSYHISDGLGPYIFKDRRQGQGTHQLHGLMMVKGEGISRNKEVAGSKIIDIPPTILYLMGISIPRAMDGKVLTEVFQAQHLKDHPIQFQEKPLEITDRGSEIQLSSQEVEEIKRGLRSLGYIS